MLDAVDISAIVAALVAAIGAVWARSRKRRKGYVFRPRAHVRFYASLRTHDGPTSSKPPPIDKDEP